MFVAASYLEQYRHLAESILRAQLFFRWALLTTGAEKKIATIQSPGKTGQRCNTISPSSLHQLRLANLAVGWLNG